MTFHTASQMGGKAGVMTPINSSSFSNHHHGLTSTGRSNTIPAPTTKGLRQFSLKVCRKVEEKGITTYNEVADDLVKDLGGDKNDQKNIRRRVYDALNVLMAMDIIRKDKKEIAWLGLPNDLLQELEASERDKAVLQQRIFQKRKTLQDLILKHSMTKNLIERNRAKEAADASQNGLDGASDGISNADLLHLPFILINASKDCKINCEMMEDRSHYFFEFFDSPFMIHEDTEVLRLLGLSERLYGQPGVDFETDCLSYMMEPMMSPNFTNPYSNSNYGSSGIDYGSYATNGNIVSHGERMALPPSNTVAPFNVTLVNYQSHHHQ